MHKLQRPSIAELQLCPQLPDAKAPLADVGIVKDDDRTRRELGQPRFEIMADCLVCMKAVDVQKVDGLIRETCDAVVEQHPKQPREPGVVLLMIGVDSGKDLLAVVARVLVALPRVNGKASGGNGGLHN